MLSLLLIKNNKEYSIQYILVLYTVEILLIIKQKQIYKTLWNSVLFVLSNLSFQNRIINYIFAQSESDRYTILHMQILYNYLHSETFTEIFSVREIIVDNKTSFKL